METRTTDAMPSLDEPAAVTDDLIEGYAADGHACVRALASPEEVAAYHPIIEAAALEHAWNKGPDGADSWEGAFLQAFNLWRLDERIARFVLSTRFAGVAAALLGVERVRLYHDQALCKGPNGGKTPWHQDHHYWPLDTDRTITMWMPLVDIPGEVGSMTFASGSHRLGDLGAGGIGRESHRTLAAVIEDRGLPTHTYGAMAAGDATFHGGWTVHSAGRNPTRLMRTVMTVIYYADGARVVGEPSEAQEVDRRAWLGGRPPGALADHEGNPVLGP